MDLIVDDRERAVIPHLLPLCEAQIHRLITGDFAFAAGGKTVVVVERKTLSDLAASIKDGRMNNNNKLLDVREKTGARIVYIIEGSPLTPPTRKFGGIAFSTLQSTLDGLAFRHNVIIIWTRGPEETAARLSRLRFKLVDMDFGEANAAVVELNEGGDSQIPPELLERKEKTVDSVHVNMLRCLKDVSGPTAILLLSKYSLHELISHQFEPEVIYNLKYPSGFIIGQRSLSICEQLIEMPLELQCKIIACIDGVSETLAATILNAIPLVSLTNWTIEIKDLANIMRPGAKPRRLGDALAKRIFMVFTAGRVDIEAHKPL